MEEKDLVQSATSESTQSVEVAPGLENREPESSLPPPPTDDHDKASVPWHVVLSLVIQGIGVVAIPLVLWIGAENTRMATQAKVAAQYRNTNETNFKNMKVGFDKLVERRGEDVVFKLFAYKVLAIAPSPSTLPLPAATLPTSFGLDNKVDPESGTGKSIRALWETYGSDYAQGPYLTVKGWQRGEDIENREEMIEELAEDGTLVVYFNLGLYDDVKKTWIASTEQFRSDRLQIQIRKPLDFNRYCDVILDPKTSPSELKEVLDRCGVVVTPFRWAWERDSFDQLPDNNTIWTSPTVTRRGVSSAAMLLANSVNARIYGEKVAPRFLIPAD